MADEEIALVRRARHGDAKAFEALVRGHQRVLYNVALRMSGNAEDARDLTQTTFLKVHQHLDGFDERFRFFSWVYRILINETLKLIERRRPQAPLRDDWVTGGASPAEECERHEAEQVVQAALLELPAPAREVIVLRHFAHLSHHAIGEALGLPDKTVKSRLYEARRRLAALLEKRGVGRP